MPRTGRIGHPGPGPLRPSPLGLAVDLGCLGDRPQPGGTPPPSHELNVHVPDGTRSAGCSITSGDKNWSGSSGVTSRGSVPFGTLAGPRFGRSYGLQGDPPQSGDPRPRPDRICVAPRPVYPAVLVGA